MPSVKIHKDAFKEKTHTDGYLSEDTGRILQTESEDIDVYTSENIKKMNTYCEDTHS